MSDLQKRLMRGKLPIPSPSFSRLQQQQGIGRKRDYSPTPWDKYFDDCKDVIVPSGDSFRVYTKGEDGPPVLFLLHGGGYSGLSWSLFSASISELVECQIVAMDVRGHGETKCTDDNDLSADTLARDVGEVVEALFEGRDEAPSVILVGHSMGGAIAVRAVYNNLVPTAIGLVVIDVVEGTAMDALQNMQSFLRGRPSSFPSLINAIEWCVRSGQVRNVESAKVSMPSQLKNAVSNNCAIRDIHLQGEEAEHDVLEAPTPRLVPAADRILEEVEEEEENQDQNPPTATPVNLEQPFRRPLAKPMYVWRIELSKTETFWRGWFEGLSDLFLKTTVPKLLLLAGVDRLDRELTVGHMQGKFQMQVLPKVGHAVHEDDPDKVAEAIATFLVRNKFTNALQEFQRPHAAC